MNVLRVYKYTEVYESVIDGGPERSAARSVRIFKHVTKHGPK